MAEKQKVREVDDLKKAKVSMEEMLVGFYRPSKYDSRLETQIKAINKILADDKAITERDKTYKALFPDAEVSPDKKNIDALKAEEANAKTIDTCINKLIKIGKRIGNYETKTAEANLTTAKAAAKTAVKSLKSSSSADSWKEAEIKYGTQAKKEAKYSTSPLAGEDDDTWNIRQLIHYLLWYTAVVNKNLRNLLARSPLELLVKNFGEPEPEEEAETKE